MTRRSFSRSTIISRVCPKPARRTLFLLFSMSIVFRFLQLQNYFYFYANKEPEEQLCRLPKLSLNHQGFQLNFAKNDLSACELSFQPVSIENYSVRLIQNNIDCAVIFYLGQGDGKYNELSMKLKFNLSLTLLSDYFTVSCKEKNETRNDSVQNSFFPTLPFASIHYNIPTRQRLIEQEITNINSDDDFNVLMLGMDSISHLQFQRMLPLTYNYLLKKPNNFILQGSFIKTIRKDVLLNRIDSHVISLVGYNILGDGTPQQLIPMLTGYKEAELPSTLYREKNASFVDVYPFLWNEYRRRGYVTGYAEDRPEYGIWTYRLKGFQKSPTDHYLTPFYRMKATKSLLRNRSSYCIGNQTTLDVFLSYIQQFWSSYRTSKKFFFGFFKQYTHDNYKKAFLLDARILGFLQQFNNIDDERKTILIIMTDHGARFTDVRRTAQGKLEERLPMMSWSFPKDFVRRHPIAIENFEKNLPRLTTPFDIHATLLSLVDMKNFKYSPITNLRQRNISLFNLISPARTCSDINLEEHWCSCLEWKALKNQNEEIRKATIFVINYINQNLKIGQQNFCHLLELDSIFEAQIYQPHQQLMNFIGSADRDGRVAKYSKNVTHILFYQINFRTKPNNAIYEATIQYSRSNQNYTFDLNQISRLNAYGSSPDCIARQHSHLRKFCLCIQ